MSSLFQAYADVYEVALYRDVRDKPSRPASDEAHAGSSSPSPSPKVPPRPSRSGEGASRSAATRLASA